MKIKGKQFKVSPKFILATRSTKYSRNHLKFSQLSKIHNKKKPKPKPTVKSHKKHNKPRPKPKVKPRHTKT